MLRCTHCGGDAQIVASETSHAGYVTRHELRCELQHQTFSLTLPNSVFHAHKISYSKLVERFLENDLKQEQVRRRRERIIMLIKEGWKVTAIAHECGCSESTVQNIKQKITAETR